MSESKGVAVYYRVSTADQTTENQKVAIAEYCISHKIAPRDVSVFEDVVSGITDLRPNLKLLVNDIENGRIKRVIVWRLDRLGRSLQHLVKLLDLFRRRKVEFTSLQESIDTSTSAGVLLYHILASMAQFERDLISERTKLALMRRKALGLSIGRITGKSKDKHKRKTAGYFGNHNQRKRVNKQAETNLIGNKVNLKMLKAKVKRQEVLVSE